MIPEGWTLESLESLASVERGRFIARPRNDPRFYGGDIPFVQTGDVRLSSGWLKTHSQTLNEEGLAVSRLFPSGTILITIAANIGDVAIATFPVACPDSLVAIQANETTSNIWLMYALQMYKQDFEALATQNAQKNINLEVLRPFEILTPPLPEQQAIAAILSTWDEAITLTAALIDALKRRKSALMSLLLTGKTQFPQFASISHDSKEIPPDWSIVSLGDIFERVEREIASAVENVLSITAGAGFVEQGAKFGRVIAGKNLERYVYLLRGEFAYNKGNSKAYPQGCIYRLDEFDAGAVPNVYYCFRAKPEYADSNFYKFYFESGALNSELRPLINAGVRNDGLLNLPANEFFDVNVLVPPLNEQAQMADFLSVVDEELDMTVQKLDRLQTQKRGLMQQLLTGAMRVAGR